LIWGRFDLGRFDLGPIWPAIRNDSVHWLCPFVIELFPFILFIVRLLEPILKRDTLRSCALPPLLQVLVTLRFLATGGFYSLLGPIWLGADLTCYPKWQRPLIMSLCYWIISLYLMNELTSPSLNSSQSTCTCIYLGVFFEVPILCHFFSCRCSSYILNSEKYFLQSINKSYQAIIHHFALMQPAPTPLAGKNVLNI
jgi:hypothetical protein